VVGQSAILGGSRDAGPLWRRAHLTGGRDRKRLVMDAWPKYPLAPGARLGAERLLHLHGVKGICAWPWETALADVLIFRVAFLG